MVRQSSRHQDLEVGETRPAAVLVTVPQWRDTEGGLDADYGRQDAAQKDRHQQC